MGKKKRARMAKKARKQARRAVKRVMPLVGPAITGLAAALGATIAAAVEPAVESAIARLRSDGGGHHPDHDAEARARRLAREREEAMRHVEW